MTSSFPDVLTVVRLSSVPPFCPSFEPSWARRDGSLSTPWRYIPQTPSLLSSKLAGAYAGRTPVPLESLSNRSFSASHFSDSEMKVANMFSFHSRSRSLIPVGDLDKAEKSYDRTYLREDELDTEDARESNTVPGYAQNMLLIYLLFLAEAVMASSLSSQIAVLLPASTECLGMNTSFLRSILEGAYFFGSASGLAWGWAADRLGRRNIALFGLVGMSACCLSMGFAKSFIAFAILRFLAGTISSAVTVAGLAMLADATHGSGGRVQTVARLPLIAVLGGIGPLLTKAVHGIVGEEGLDAFSQYLNGQIICASAVGAITLIEILLLKETLPATVEPKHSEPLDCEKAAFLGQSLPNSSEVSLSISIIEALNDQAAIPRPSHIDIAAMVSAPSVFILLASFSVLSLHSSTFDILLPHVGHGPSSNLGMGIPCAWVDLVSMLVNTAAAYWVLAALPSIVSQGGVLQVYRRISLVFPGLYMLIPGMGIALGVLGGMPWLSAIVSVIAMSAKAALSSSAEVLALVLVLSAAPDAFSTGTLVGVMSVSQFFRAMAVGVSGVTFYLSDDHSMVMVNLALWAVLAGTAFAGAALTWKMRETPRVGTDIPEECLVWEDMFDSSENGDIAHV